MLNCRQIAQMSSDYLDRTDLTWQQRAQFKMHLMMCSTCRRFVGQLDLLRHTLPQKSVPEPDQAQIDRWLDAVSERDVPSEPTNRPH